VFQHSHWKCIM